MNDAVAVSSEDLSPDAAAVGPRLKALRTVLERFERAKTPPPPQLFDALAEGTLDAVFARDVTTLSEIAGTLRRITAQWGRRRDERAWAEVLGRLRASLVIAVGAANRLPNTSALSAIGIDTQAHHVLRELEHSESMATRALLDRLGLRRDALSRTTRTLRQHLLVTRVKAGQTVFWEITPRGRDVLADLDARERAMRPRPGRRGVTSDVVVDLFSGEPLSISSAELDAKRQHVSSPREDSWLMLLKLLSEHPQELGNRLKIWDPLAKFATADPSFLALPPETTDSELRGAPWKALQHVYGKSFERDAWNTMQPPLWDAFAHIPGPDGRHGIVLIEAKSRESELVASRTRPRAETSMRVFEALLAETSAYLKAKHRWPVWPEYPDAARRLAFLHYLLQFPEVEAWICNVYFVEPADGSPGGLLQSSLDWEVRLSEVRESLQIGQEHPLSPYIRHEYFPAPYGTERITERGSARSAPSRRAAPPARRAGRRGAGARGRGRPTPAA